MKRLLTIVVAVSALALGASLFAQSAPDIAYDANADLISLPSFGEVAGVATNSKGHLFVYARTGHAVATLGDERTFYHGGSRLFQFDQAGKFVKEIGQGVYSVNFAQQVRVDPQDNVWIVDAGSNMVVKFDADGRLAMVLGRKPENITLRQGPGAPARQLDVRAEGAAGAAEGGRGGGRGGAEGGRGGGGRGGGTPGPERSVMFSGFLPSTIASRPSGSNFTTMFEPASTIQTLSCGSTRTCCAKLTAYTPCPISLTYLPF